MKIDILGGYYLQIEGAYFDLVKFYNSAGKKIGDANIRNGNNLNGTGLGLVGSALHDITVRPQFNGFSLVAVRHGTLRDLVYAYAVANDTVYQSQEWRDIGPGSVSGGVTVSFTVPTGTGFSGEGFDIAGIGWGALSWHYASLQWLCVAGNTADYIGNTSILPVLP